MAISQVPISKKWSSFPTFDGAGDDPADERTGHADEHRDEERIQPDCGPP